MSPTRIQSLQLLLRPATLGIAAATLAALAACGDEPGQSVGQSVGQKLDETVTTVESKAEQASERIRQETTEARRDVGAAIDDAQITAKVNAELARDSELSALRIDVDTDNGRVVLAGTAPSGAARERAGVLAKSIEGVVEVDNRLSVNAG
jgi:osmotically-inducible protein OsmY